jgi:NAD(P)H-nitrite reductase large subunit
LKATKLDATKKEVTYKDGSTMKYDKLFIGTGGR